jgi:hypothetical protein
MLNIAQDVLFANGATEVRDLEMFNDPQTEEEFSQLHYTSPTPITWEQYQAALPECLHKRGLKIIRSRRNTCLQKTDYVMTFDFINTISNRDDWITYRQSLRDFPDEVRTIVWVVPGLTIDWDATGFPKEPLIIK